MRRLLDFFETNFKKNSDSLVKIIIIIFIILRLITVLFFTSKSDKATVIIIFSKLMEMKNNNKCKCRHVILKKRHFKIKLLYRERKMVEAKSNFDVNVNPDVIKYSGARRYLTKCVARSLMSRDSHKSTYWTTQRNWCSFCATFRYSADKFLFIINIYWQS